MKKILFVFLFACGITLLSSFEIPNGWFVSGSQAKSYNMGTAQGEGRDGKNCATIQSIEPKIKGFGTLMQLAKSEIYLGKRVRMSGYVRSKDVKKWAGLWFRVDGKNADGKPIQSFDNMQKRSIKGTTEWTKYELVLDVPMETTNLAFGALLQGTGQIWFDDISFDIVDTSIPTTNMLKQKKS